MNLIVSSDKISIWNQRAEYEKFVRKRKDSSPTQKDNNFINKNEEDSIERWSVYDWRSAFIHPNFRWIIIVSLLSYIIDLPYRNARSGRGARGRDRQWWRQPDARLAFLQTTSAHLHEACHRKRGMLIYSFIFLNKFYKSRQEVCINWNSIFLAENNILLSIKKIYIYISARKCFLLDMIEKTFYLKIILFCWEPVTDSCGSGHLHRLRHSTLLRILAQLAARFLVHSGHLSGTGIFNCF